MSKGMKNFWKKRRKKKKGQMNEWVKEGTIFEKKEEEIKRVKWTNE